MNLLDVNLLIALCDADHEHHVPVTQWFRAHRAEGWATCPLTENGLLRVMGHPAYPGGPGTPEGVRPLLQYLRASPGHLFWADSISIMDSQRVPSLQRVSAKQLTDIYLLALAVRHGGGLATLDARIDSTQVPGGEQALVLVPS